MKAFPSYHIARAVDDFNRVRKHFRIQYETHLEKEEIFADLERQIESSGMFSSFPYYYGYFKDSAKRWMGTFNSSLYNKDPVIFHGYPKAHLKWLTDEVDFISGKLSEHMNFEAEATESNLQKAGYRVNEFRSILLEANSIEEISIFSNSLISQLDFIDSFWPTKYSQIWCDDLKVVHNQLKDRSKLKCMKVTENSSIEIRS